MSFEKTFCPSPWFHMHINNAGGYEFCRWATKDQRHALVSTANTDPGQFFQKNMIEIRQHMIDGTAVPQCNLCYKMEDHQKVSGRQRQLLKIGVTVDNFEKTMRSSPWLDHMSTAETQLLPQDWQIDLGNFCNSGCVFCTPQSSSRLAAEFKKLKIIDQLPANSWCDDPAQLDKFIHTLKKSPVVRYLHFIGGETLITPAFKTILQELIRCDLHQNISIGFTTNLITWDHEISQLLPKFKQVNVGLSVECFDQLNDYVRWPSQLSTVTHTLSQWLALAQQHQWLVQLRVTPTMLTVSKLLTVYEYAWQHNIAVESCNFLEQPEFLRISVLPVLHRQAIVAQMQQWLDTHTADQNQVVNTRNPNFTKNQIVQDLASYVSYLKNETDHSHQLPQCVQYLKRLETNRKNSILDYLPEYEQLFRSAGY